MKRIAFVVGLVVLAFGAFILASTQAVSVEQELMNLENGWAKSMVKLDLAFMEGILADDYMWTGGNGTVYTRAQEIESLKSGEGLVVSAVNDEMKVRVYGDAAVVTGLTTEKIMEKGKEVSGQFRWTDTWIKRDGRWQCVANHSSNLPQK